MADIFDHSRLEHLKGDAAIGHTRYSTAGESARKNAQPLVVSCSQGDWRSVITATLINAFQVRRQLEKSGRSFSSTTDSEVILHLIARSRQGAIEDAIQEALSQLTGAYSLIFLTREKVIAVRDPRGFRPLNLGWLDGSPVLASETCAFDLIEARFEREVAPGEMLTLFKDGTRSRQISPRSLPPSASSSTSTFQADSHIFGRSVYESRHLLGRTLAQEKPVEADIVVPVPDSGVAAAIGFSHESKIPVRVRLIRHHYVGRTFIEPKQSIRHFGVKIKLNPLAELIRGKRVVLVDDSIVRGRPAERSSRWSGTPAPWKCTCASVARPPSPLLLRGGHAYQEGVDRLQPFGRRNSQVYRGRHLGYLSHEGMLRSCGVEQGQGHFCSACYTGDYPVPFPRCPRSRLLNHDCQDRLCFPDAGVDIDRADAAKKRIKALARRTLRRR